MTKRFTTIFILLCFLLTAFAFWSVADVVLGKANGQYTYETISAGNVRVKFGGSAPPLDVGTPEIWYPMNGQDTNTVALTNWGAGTYQVSLTNYDATNLPTVATGPAQINYAGTLCYYFDASDDRFATTLIHSNLLWTPAVGHMTDMTVTVWFKPINVGLQADGIIAMSAPASQVPLWYMLYYDNHIYFRVGGLDINADLICNTNIWWNFALTYDASNSIARVYTNGIFCGAKTNAYFVVQTNFIVEIGQNRSYAWKAKGYIDDARIFRYSLGSNQVKNIYTEGRK